MNTPLVSIIIPTYNRAHLISETLDSIFAQTYTNWECIVVDDRSTDNTEEVLKPFTNIYQRFQYYNRPNSKPKGANSCRNIGLEKAKGDFIIFFDSDDLMAPNHIEIKLKAIQKNDYDYVIAQARFFNHDKGNILLEKQYNFQTKDISSYNYVSHKINWLTIDTLIKSNLAKSISFNELLSSGQEYNYFCKLVLKSTKATFIKSTVTFMRYHDNSIRGLLRKNKIEQSQSYLSTYWHTYLDIKEKAPKKAKVFLIYRCYRLLGKLPIKEKLFENNIIKAILIEFGVKGFYYIFRLYLKRII